jgi:hypothetical protein|tara:strand:+ start:149 stop:463 length:315 start_codon:yes stop_codon:yes gene_type:complete
MSDVIPKNIVFEFNVKELNGRGYDRGIVSLVADGKRMDKYDAENHSFFTKKVIDLFKLGVNGVEIVNTGKHSYRFEGPRVARLDDLGERGGYHQIIRVEYNLIE